MLEHGSKYTEKQVRKIPTVRGADIMRDPKLTKVCHSASSKCFDFCILGNGEGTCLKRGRCLSKIVRGTPPSQNARYGPI